MAEVRIERQEDFEKALRKFKVQCKGIIKEYRERQYFIKPSQKKRKTSKKKRKG